MERVFTTKMDSRSFVETHVNRSTYCSLSGRDCGCQIGGGHLLIRQTKTKKGEAIHAQQTCVCEYCPAFDTVRARARSLARKQWYGNGSGSSSVVV